MKGNYEGYREFNISGDLLVTYKIEIATIDCKGLYFKDIGNIFKNKKVLNKKGLEENFQAFLV